MTGKEILELEIRNDDTERVSTIREYLKELVALVITEEEGFSGKKPWGNSDWQYSLGAALVRAGAIEGTSEAEMEAGEYYFDRSEMKKAIVSAIEAM